MSEGTVWPRKVWACLEPGCHYLERYHLIPSVGPWPSCPGHPDKELAVVHVTAQEVES